MKEVTFHTKCYYKTYVGKSCFWERHRVVPIHEVFKYKLNTLIESREFAIKTNRIPHSCEFHEWGTGSETISYDILPSVILKPLV